MSESPSRMTRMSAPSSPEPSPYRTKSPIPQQMLHSLPHATGLKLLASGATDTQKDIDKYLVPEGKIPGEDIRSSGESGVVMTGQSSGKGELGRGYSPSEGELSDSEIGDHPHEQTTMEDPENLHSRSSGGNKFKLDSRIYTLETNLQEAYMELSEMAKKIDNQEIVIKSLKNKQEIDTEKLITKYESMIEEMKHEFKQEKRKLIIDTTLKARSKEEKKGGKNSGKTPSQILHEKKEESIKFNKMKEEVEENARRTYEIRLKKRIQEETGRIKEELRMQLENEISQRFKNSNKSNLDTDREIQTHMLRSQLRAELELENDKKLQDNFNHWRIEMREGLLEQVRQEFMIKFEDEKAKLDEEYQIELENQVEIVKEQLKNTWNGHKERLEQEAMQQIENEKEQMKTSALMELRKERESQLLEQLRSKLTNQIRQELMEAMPPLIEAELKDDIANNLISEFEKKQDAILKQKEEKLVERYKIKRAEEEVKIREDIYKNYVNEVEKQVKKSEKDIRFQIKKQNNQERAKLKKGLEEEHENKLREELQLIKEEKIELGRLKSVDHLESRRWQNKYLGLKDRLVEREVEIENLYIENESHKKVAEDIRKGIIHRKYEEEENEIMEYSHSQNISHPHGNNKLIENSISSNYDLPRLLYPKEDSITKSRLETSYSKLGSPQPGVHTHPLFNMAIRAKESGAYAAQEDKSTSVLLGGLDARNRPHEGVTNSNMQPKNELLIPDITELDAYNTQQLHLPSQNMPSARHMVPKYESSLVSSIITEAQRKAEQMSIDLGEQRLQGVKERSIQYSQQLPTELDTTDHYRKLLPASGPQVQYPPPPGHNTQSDYKHPIYTNNYYQQEIAYSPTPKKGKSVRFNESKSGHVVKESKANIWKSPTQYERLVGCFKPKCHKQTKTLKRGKGNQTGSTGSLGVSSNTSSLRGTESLSALQSPRKTEGYSLGMVTRFEEYNGNEFGMYYAHKLEREQENERIYFKLEEETLSFIEDKLHQKGMSDHGMLGYLLDLWDSLEFSFSERISTLKSYKLKEAYEIYSALEKATTALTEQKQIMYEIFNLNRKKTELMQMSTRKQQVQQLRFMILKKIQEVGQSGLNVMWRGIDLASIIKFEGWKEEFDLTNQIRSEVMHSHKVKNANL